MKVTNKVRITLLMLSLLFIGAGWPLKEKLGLTSTFGEWREGHVHAGIDLPTEETGKEVYSVSDGWVMRVRTSPWGYGKAIYIKDSLGRVFVYAHLSSFSKSIKKRVREEQLKELTYKVDIWFKKGEIPVKEGEIIGISGRSGCYAPHLHFEMRDTENNPVDPLIRGFSIPDNIPPEIYAIRFVPLDDTSTICGSHLGAIFHTGRDIPSVCIKGRVGLEIETYDKVNGHSGLLSPKEIELYIGGKLVRKENYDRFSYTHDGDSRFEFDFTNRVRTGRKFRRLFTVLGNDLPFYEGRDGILTTKDHGLVSIIVKDAASNESKISIFLGDSNARNYCRFKRGYENFLNFTIFTNGILLRKDNSLGWIEASKIGKIVKSGDSILVWNIDIKRHPLYKSPDSRCIIYPSNNAILNTSLISVKVSKEKPIKWVWEPPIPLNGRITMEIKAPFEPNSYSIYELLESEWKYCETYLEGNKLITTIDNFGTFTCLVDTVPPSIFLKKNYLNSNTPIIVHVSDSLSGIDFFSIKTLIDEKPTVFRYDPEMDRLIHEYPEEISGDKHTLRIFLKDKQGNEASGEWEFYKGY